MCNQNQIQPSSPSAYKHTEYLYPVVHKTSLQNVQAKPNPTLSSAHKFGTHGSSLLVLASTPSISTQQFRKRRYKMCK